MTGIDLNTPPVSNTLLERRGRLLPVAEVFGPTIQGEGSYQGHQAMFARLGLCNLSCSWCDTPYTWDRTRYDVAAECPDMDADDLVTRLCSPPGRWPQLDAPPGTVAPPRMVVLTGGEPLIHQRAWGWLRLLDALDDAHRMIHVETNGTIAPTPITQSRVRHFTVSPKLANNGRDPQHRRLNHDALDEFGAIARRGWADFKFVVTTPDDLDEVAALTTVHRVPAARVWIMPEGTDADQVIARQRQLADAVIARGWNLSTRLQVLLWGAERGR